MIKYFLDTPVHGGKPHTFSQKTEGSSGFDLHANIHEPKHLGPHGRFLVPTGLYLEMPDGVEAQIRGRSGLTMNHGLSPLLGTVDSDYRGEVSVCLFNHTAFNVDIQPGERIAQVVFCPILPQFYENLMAILEQGKKIHMTVRRVASKDHLAPTLRGSSGHGSTGS